MVSGSIGSSMCMLKFPMSSNLPRLLPILLCMMSVMSLQNCKTVVAGSLWIIYRFITVPVNLISNVLISIVSKSVLSSLVFFTEILSLYTKARPLPCLPDLHGCDITLYSCGTISLIVFVSALDLIHVSLIAPDINEVTCYVLSEVYNFFVNESCVYVGDLYGFGCKFAY